MIIYYCIIGLGQFYIFSAIFGYLILAVGGMLIFAYKTNNLKMIRISRIILVILTICGFFKIFIDTMLFNDAMDALS
jgi:hypothetical protein